MGLKETTRRLYGRLRGIARSYLLVGVPDHPENGGLTGDRRAREHAESNDGDDPDGDTDRRH